MRMPKVRECSVSECAYNKDQKCHAIAITVGDSVHPECDTFCPSSIKGGDMGCLAGVGACKVSVCMHNSNLECQAQDVCIGKRGNEIDCLTYSHR